MPNCPPETAPVLPRAHQMVDPEDFRLTFRKGTRAGNPALIVHARTDEEGNDHLVGFVVPKREIKRANGRDRVKRWFRHLIRERLDTLPEGSRVVVRASGRALELNSHQLVHHLDSALERTWKRWDSTY